MSRRFLGAPRSLRLAGSLRLRPPQNAFPPSLPSSRRMCARPAPGRTHPQR